MNGQNILLSIVSPVYQAEKIVPLLVQEIKKYAAQITPNYEIVLVEDGSNDSSWEMIQEECLKDRKVIGLKLSRNFGQHYAITAGLDHANGEWVIVMDCDLQDKPSEIPMLFEEAQKGFDIVLARRKSRTDNFFKRVYSKLFYKTLGYLTGTNQDASVANFGIYNKKVIEAVRSMREPIRYFPTMVKWVGFNLSTINVKHGEREIGKTTYSFRRMFKLARDIILANSERPIYAIVLMGFIVSLISFIIGVIALIGYFAGRIEVVGYASLIISIWFIGGIIIMILGVIGLYLGKTFEAVKDRPIYIIEKHLNGRDS